MSSAAFRVSVVEASKAASKTTDSLGRVWEWLGVVAEDDNHWRYWEWKGRVVAP